MAHRDTAHGVLAPIVLPVRALSVRIGCARLLSLGGSIASVRVLSSLIFGDVDPLLHARYRPVATRTGLTKEHQDKGETIQRIQMDD